MARSQRLNVYVTPAGFYDAVIAAPNQKAALEAWGAQADLFAQKLAEAETDQAWRAKALASPGEVLKKPRGDAAELLARPAPAKRAAAKKSATPAGKLRPSTPPPKPPADRSKLDDAEAAVEHASGELQKVRDAFAQQRSELEEAERLAVRDAQAVADKAEAARKREATAFERASR